MWIRSQNKDCLVKVDTLKIYYLNNQGYGIFTNNHIPPNERMALGYYTTKGKALKVLNEIQRFIDNKCSMLVFEMPEDDKDKELYERGKYPWLDAD